MTGKKMLALFIILIATPTSRSQKVQVIPDTIRVDTVKVETSVAHKIDSINADTYKTALRVQKKAARLSDIARNTTMQSNLNSRIKLYVSEIKPKELPVTLSPPEVDTIQKTHKTSKFLFWKR